MSNKINTLPNALMEKQRQKRMDLALAYRICAYLKMDDLTYSHLSVRVPQEQALYIYPFGMLYKEVTASSLIKVSFDGEILEGCEKYYNRTGYILHSVIYQKRPDIEAIFHHHSMAVMAVSAQKQGLLPLSQHALHFYQQINYHDYDSLILERENQGQQLIKDLADKYILLLRNHGALVCGTTIAKAMFYSYHLERACQLQSTLSGVSVDNLVMPSAEKCQKAYNDLIHFEKNLGQRDWQTWQRLMTQMSSDYRD